MSIANERKRSLNNAGELIPDAKQETYTITNDLTDRAFDADAVAVTELADVVATLLKDLETAGVLKTA